MRIQPGILATVNGDTILIANGVYTGSGNKNLAFVGKVITVMSANSAESSVIDCEHDGRGVSFDGVSFGWR
ncbi:hypothetical protein JXA80_14530 [bacterium]|nr:hypothetical protein [candidate division CSSED10-310 bacterium]